MIGLQLCLTPYTITYTVIELFIYGNINIQLKWLHNSILLTLLDFLNIF